MAAAQSFGIVGRPTLQEAAIPDTDRNKSNVIAFYELMFNDCRPREAIVHYVGDTYIQHNPHLADGIDGFIAYFERMARE